MLSIDAVIRNNWKKFTLSERRLGTFFLQHLEELPFETAASIANQVGVSPMTCGRFIRKLGYADLGGVKATLRAAALASRPFSRQVSRRLFDGVSFKCKIKALADVERLPASAEWPAIVSLLATAQSVHVASFQMGRFIGLEFASALQTMRPHSYFADGGDGGYIDALLDSNAKSCIVLIDFRRYSRHFRLLAEEAAARRIPMIIITDAHCHWARQFTDHVLLLKTDSVSSWECMGVVQAALALLLVEVAKRRKDRVQRYEAIHRLRERFVGFENTDGGAARRSHRRSRKAAGPSAQVKSRSCRTGPRA